jgi:hypothetical protein
MSFLNKYRKYFVYSISILFLLTGSSKIVSSFQALPILDQNDPVIYFLSNKLLYRIIGLSEVLFAFILLFLPVRVVFKMFSIFAISVIFLYYRYALYSLKTPTPCKCLGNQWSWLPLSDRQISNLLLFLLVYMFFLSSIYCANALIPFLKTWNGRVVRAKNKPV